MAAERCFGTYIHGLFDNEAVVDRLLAPFRDSGRSSAEFDYVAYKESQYDALADWLRRYVDIPRLYEIMREK